MKAIWVLAQMTFHEAIRRRIVLTGLVLGVCFLLVFSLGFHMIIGQIHEESAEGLPSGPALVGSRPWRGAL